jgi:hypothetical protein
LEKPRNQITGGLQESCRKPGKDCQRAFYDVEGHSTDSKVPPVGGPANRTARVEGNNELFDVHVELFSGSILKILILGKSDWQDFCPALINRP